MCNEKKRRRIEGVMNKRVFSPEHEVAADLTQSGNSVARADLGHTPCPFLLSCRALSEFRGQQSISLTDGDSINRCLS